MPSRLEHVPEQHSAFASVRVSPLHDAPFACRLLPHAPLSPQTLLEHWLFLVQGAQFARLVVAWAYPLVAVNVVIAGTSRAAAPAIAALRITSRRTMSMDAAGRAADPTNSPAARSSSAASSRNPSIGANPSRVGISLRIPSAVHPPSSSSSMTHAVVGSRRWTLSPRES